MENIGKEPTVIHGSIHGPGYVGSTGIEAPYTLPGKQRFADDFHVFAIEWDPNSVSFLVDQDLTSAAPAPILSRDGNGSLTNRSF